MPIRKLCANLLIPNRLCYNLSYLLSGASVLYVNVYKLWCLAGKRRGLRALLLQYLPYVLQVVYFLQPAHDGLDLVAVVHLYLYLSLEDAFVGGEGHLVDVDVHLVGYDFCHVVQHALAVDAVHFNRRVEIERAVHVPACVEYAGAEACLEL